MYLILTKNLTNGTGAAIAKESEFNRQKIWSIFQTQPFSGILEECYNYVIKSKVE